MLAAKRHRGMRDFLQVVVAPLVIPVSEELGLLDTSRKNRVGGAGCFLDGIGKVGAMYLFVITSTAHDTHGDASVRYEEIFFVRFVRLARRPRPARSQTPGQIAVR